MRTTIEIKRSDAARALFEAAGVIHSLQSAGALEDDHFVAEVRSSLEAIADLTANRMGASLRVRAGRYYIRLKKGLSTTVVAGTQAAVAALDPTPLTKAAAAAMIVAYLSSLRDLLSRLDDPEVEVYEAICAIIWLKRADGKLLEIKEASDADISEFLQRNTDAVPSNPGEILGSLALKGAISRVFDGSGRTFYAPIF